MLALTQSPPPIVDDIDFSNEEQEVQIIRAAVAKRLNVSSEAVDVVVRDTGGRLEIINVRVFLSASEARRIAGQSA
jgi:signal recognition particle GTPase